VILGNPRSVLMKRGIFIDINQISAVWRRLSLATLNTVFAWRVLVVETASGNSQPYCYTSGPFPFDELKCKDDAQIKQN